VFNPLYFIRVANSQEPILPSLAAGVLVGEEKVLLVFGPLVKKGMMLPGSVMLGEEEEMVLSSGALVATWCFWGLFS